MLSDCSMVKPGSLAKAPACHKMEWHPHVLTKVNTFSSSTVCTLILKTWHASMRMLHLKSGPKGKLLPGRGNMVSRSLCTCAHDVRAHAHVRARACVCVCQRKTKDRADGMREKKCPFPSTGFEPAPVGYAPIVLTPREQARLASVETNTSDTHPPAPSWNTSMHCVCVCMCHNEKRCQTNGKHD